MDMTAAQIVLASSSPRRQELLQQLGVVFDVVVPDIDESWQAGESVEEHVVRLAVSKAQKGWTMQSQNCLPVLGSDTIVVVDDQVLGKPRDEFEASQMLTSLSGRSHRVLTAVAMVDQQRETHSLSESRVTFRRLDKREIDAYWASGEPVGKAGSYAVQGLGAIFIERIEGSFSGVMGLPVYETAELLKQFSIDVLQNNEKWR